MNAPASFAAIEPHSPYAMPFPEKATAAATARAKAVVSARYEVALHKPRNWDQVRQEVVRECRRPSFANDKGTLYRKPVGNGVEGLGIRFVEMALRCMKNVEINTELSYEDEFKEIHRCSVTDLEANVPYATEIPVSKTVERSKPEDDGSYFKVRLNSFNRPVYTVSATDDDMLNKRGALLSKAIRTLGLRLIPGDIQSEAEQVIRQTRLDQAAKDPDAERRRVIDAFAELAVRAVDLVEYLGHPVDRCSPTQLVELRGLYSAIRDGEATWKQVMDAKAEREAGQGDRPPVPPAPAAGAALRSEPTAPPRKAKPAEPPPALEPQDEPEVEAAVQAIEQRAAERATDGVVEVSQPEAPAPAPAVAQEAPQQCAEPAPAPQPAAKPGVFMATPGERQHIFTRMRGRTQTVEQLLLQCGIAGIDQATLEGLTKEQFKQLRAALA